jgi:hypothetical protein
VKLEEGKQGMEGDNIGRGLRRKGKMTGRDAVQAVLPCPIEL